MVSTVVPEQSQSAAVNDEQPEGASKRAREDDPEEGVPADDAAASAAASESASAQDGPDAEAGEILTASEGLAAASLASAVPMAAAPASGRICLC